MMKNSEGKYITGSDEDEDITAAVAEALTSGGTDVPAAWIDVTVPLRFQVQDSRLTFHKASFFYFRSYVLLSLAEV